MAKNFKGKAQKPPLSAVDKVIYLGSSLVLLLIGVFSLYCFAGVLPSKAAFADPSVIALGSKGILFTLPMMLFLSLVLPCIILIGGYSQKLPLLGNPQYKAPAFSHTIKTFPLFSHAFFDNLTSQQKQHIKKDVTLLLVVFSICLMLLPFSLFPRVVFTNQHEFITYNAFNQVTQQYHLSNAQRLGIEAHYSNGGIRNGPFWWISMNFIVPAEEPLVLTPQMFSQMTDEEALQYMLYLKSLFQTEAYEVLRTDLLEDVIRDQRYTDAEAKLLYQLFDVTP